MIITILIALAVLCLVFQLVTCLIVIIRKFRQTYPSVPDWQNQGVTILRPVAGLENNLERTLMSTFQLGHDKIDIIFCVAKADDPAIPLVEKLISSHPEKQARLLIGDDPISQNPKLNNLIKGWRQARHDWIVMTDSNVLLPSDYITQLFSRWRDDTGLIASPPLGTEAKNFAAALEAAFLNSYQARWQLCADMIGFGFAQGKTLFWHRDVLEKGGGIEALAAELAEDAAATKLVRAQGLKVRLSPMPFAQPLGKKNWKATWQRQARWAKLRRDSFPFFFYLEILSGPVFPVLCLVLAHLLGGFSPLSPLIDFLVIWYIAEVAMAFIAGWPWRLHQTVAVIGRDLLLPFLWFSAFGRGGYQWQGHKVEIKK